MRLDEVIAPPTGFAATKRFLDSYANYIQGNRSSLPTKFAQFCQAKLDNEPVSSDYAFSGSTPLSGYWHYHIVRGKIIIIYRRAGDTVRLYDIVEHTAYDTPLAVKRLSEWANSLTDADFMPLDVSTLTADPGTEKPKVTAEQKSVIDHAIYDLVGADGFFILKNALEKNDWRAFFEYVESEVPGLTESDIFVAYGGQNRLKDFILKTINRFGKLQAYQQS